MHAHHSRSYTAIRDLNPLGICYILWRLHHHRQIFHITSHSHKPRPFQWIKFTHSASIGSRVQLSNIDKSSNIAETWMMQNHDSLLSSVRCYRTETCPPKSGSTGKYRRLPSTSSHPVMWEEICSLTCPVVDTALSATPVGSENVAQLEWSHKPGLFQLFMCSCLETLLDEYLEVHSNLQLFKQRLRLGEYVNFASFQFLIFHS